MENTFAEVSVKGRLIKVPATMVDDFQVVVNGGWLKTAEVHDEPWLLRGIDEPGRFIEKLRHQGLRADIFTFSQRLPDSQPKYSYRFVEDNVAAVTIETYDKWWESLPQETRKNVRRAGKRGVVVNASPFNDELVRGIKGLYDESPIRQGRRFWHYGKELDAIKRENSSYLDRCEFIGAYFEGELIGFLKMVYIGNAGRIMQILSKNSHYDKRPMNALVAKAVEICAAKGMTYFIYGKYVYGNNADASIIEFKRRSGFEALTFPKYYVSLTSKGAIAMKLKLHLGLRRLIPKKLENVLLNLRSRAYQKSLPKQSDLEDKNPNQQ